MFGRRAFIALLAGVLLTLTLTMAASALAVGGSVDLSLETTQTGGADAIALSGGVGGGIWDYGVDGTWNPLKKHCYSNYFHRYKVHSSTAVIGSAIDFSGKVGAGKWSYASVIGSVFSTAKAYWNTY